MDIPEEYIPIVEGQLWKKIITEGTGEQPLVKSSVNVHYVGTLFSDGEKFDSSRDRGSPFNFKLGVGQVIKGWDEGVATMKVGELAELVCGPEYAYGARGSPPKIPANSTLKFEVELLGFTESADNPTAKLALAQKKKDLGNEAFKIGDNIKAAEHYKEGSDLLKDMQGATEEQYLESGSLRMALMSNLAAAYLKTNDCDKAADICHRALSLQPDNAKITYRLGSAYLGLGEYEDARNAFKRGQELLPDDKSFGVMIKTVDVKEAAFKKKQKAAYSKMFQ